MHLAGHRLQLQNELGRSLFPGRKPQGMFGTAAGIFKHEGPRALYSGLAAATIRQAVYGGIGLGFYQPVRFGWRRLCVRSDARFAHDLLFQEPGNGWTP